MLLLWVDGRPDLKNPKGSLFDKFRMRLHLPHKLDV